MFERGDESYLIRAINRNQVTLFVGSGFSTLAKNRLGNQLPTGGQFSKFLWEFLEYREEFDPNALLSELYEALLASGKPTARITDFLNSHLQAVDVPREYQAIARVFWSRIYTTNIDNLLELIYGQVRTPRLDVRSFPNDELPDRDIMLDRLQAVYLHGHLPCAPSEVTFSISQYARRATPFDHLYDHFVRDYATKTTIFIGTALNEPLLWQYIEIRRAKRAELGEERPKSFLISPAINAPKRQLLDAMNVVPVIGTTNDFLSWLASKESELASRDDVLKVTIPGLVELVGSVSSGNEGDRRSVQEFGRYFHTIPTDVGTASRERSLFLMGASPKWEDLLSQRDAPREITSAVVDAVQDALTHDDSKLVLFPILGSAGSGKSTLLRRIAIQLAQAGHTCFLTNSEELARFEDIARALTHIGKRSVLFFDNAETVVGSLPRLLSTLLTVEHPPICLIACRTNDFDRMAPKIPAEVACQEFHVPHLSRTEIRSLLAVLDRENLLGQLKGMSAEQRVAEFESKAGKQLLVAMREATSGRGFDEIIEDEFRTLTPDEVKILYLCVALATDAGYRMTIQEFVGASRAGAADSLSYLNRNLRDIVLRTGVADDLLMLRHRRIAEYVVGRSAPREILREAYHRLLGVLSSEIGGKPRRSRTFSLYKALIHHHTVFKRFGENFDEARFVYDSVLAKFSRNAQFLLQYGCLEMEAGNLDTAQNYLDQADSLDQGNAFIANAKGQLLLKRGIKALTKPSAVQFRDEGSSILLANIQNPELDDAYCYHIYCSLRLHWTRVWAETKEEKRKELEHLRIVVNEAFRRYGKDKRIGEVKLEIERDLFSMAVH
ncbi:MAG: SIR2 family protein [Polaromonas sp.]|nr:SIR2 family protein [Polaromonas sp.]